MYFLIYISWMWKEYKAAIKEDTEYQSVVFEQSVHSFKLANLNANTALIKTRLAAMRVTFFLIKSMMIHITENSTFW